MRCLSGPAKELERPFLHPLVLLGCFQSPISCYATGWVNYKEKRFTSDQSFGLELAEQCRILNQGAPCICLSPPPQRWDNKHTVPSLIFLRGFPEPN